MSRHITLYHWDADSPTRGADFEAAWAEFGRVSDERFIADPQIKAHWRELGLADVVAAMMDTGRAVVVTEEGVHELGRA